MPLPHSFHAAQSRRLPSRRNRALAECAAGARALHDGQTDVGLARYARGVQLAPDDADVAAVHGVALRSANRLQDAQRELIRAIALDRTRADSYTQLAQTYRLAGDRAQAADAFLAAAALQPDDAMAWRDAAESLRLAGRLADGLHVARHAAQLAPTDASIANTTALLLHRSGDVDAALAICARARQEAPDDVQLTLTHAMLLRTCGDFAQGWALHERRLELPALTARPFPPVSPRWNGEALAGRRLLVRAEQGLGDQVQFVRWASLLHSRGASSVTVQVAAPLVTLLTNVPGIDVTVSMSDAAPAHDLHVDMLSLPHLLQTGGDMQSQLVPYIAAAVPERDAALALPQRRDGVCRLGLVWSGTPLHADDSTRSMPLRTLESVISRADAEIVILQQGTGRAQLDDVDPAIRSGFLDVAADCHDLHDTAQVIAQCDAVLSVDTSVAHVAGALGVPTWIMVAEPAEWRWGRTGSDSLFYPSARVFRQRSGGDWSAVVSAVQSAITDWHTDRKT